MFINEQIRRYFLYLESKGRLFNFCIGFVCSLVVIFLDINDNQDYSFAFFYLFPIALTTWFSGRFPGILISFVCSLSWVIDNHTHLSLSLAWNTVSTICVFLIISILVYKVRIMWESERKQSRIDFLTGFLNTRAFQELLEYEINQLDRNKNPLTIAYIDLDNFKEINDRYGHIRGDELLKSISRSLSKSIRKTDVIARMGGDEFVIMLPGTNQEEARVALHKIRGKLINDLKDEHWPTTLSIGVVTCLNAPDSSEQLISMADSQMYEVKRDGKNSVRFSVYRSDGGNQDTDNRNGHN